LYYHRFVLGLCEESWSGASVLLPSYTNRYPMWQVSLSIIFRDLGEIFGTVCAKSRKSPVRWTRAGSDARRVKAPGCHWLVASGGTAAAGHHGPSSLWQHEGLGGGSANGPGSKVRWDLGKAVSLGSKRCLPVGEIGTIAICVGNTFLPTSYSDRRLVDEMQCVEGEVKQAETVGMTVKTLKGENSQFFEWVTVGRGELSVASGVSVGTERLSSSDALRL